MPEFVMMEKSEFNHLVQMVSETNRLIKDLNIKQDDPLISNDALAEKLGKSTKTILKWRKAGLKFVARGHCIFYKMSDVEDFLTLKIKKR